MKILFTLLRRIIFVSTFFLFYSKATAQVGRVQLIHNIADPSAPSVDVYLNDVLLEDDFAYQEATAFMDVTADVPVKISIAPSTSMSSASALQDFNITFASNTKNVLVASGVVGTGFEANPDGRSTDLSLKHLAAAKELSLNPSNVEFSILHGATDTGILDVLVEGETPTANNIGYGDFSSYLSIPVANHTLHVTDYAITDTLSSFDIDLSTRGGQAAIIFLSGFSSPATNNNGSSLGLFAAFPDGTVVPLTNTGITGVFGLSHTITNISAYPMPSSGSITLEINDQLTQEVTIEVVNAYGQIVNKEFNLAGNNQIKLDLSHLNTGEYYIKAVSAERVGVVRCLIVK